MLRANITAVMMANGSDMTVRQGETNGRQWRMAFISVLDEDFNKSELMLRDERMEGQFMNVLRGTQVEVVVDISTRGNRLDVQVVDLISLDSSVASPVSAAVSDG